MQECSFGIRSVFTYTLNIYTLDLRLLLLPMATITIYYMRLTTEWMTEADSSRWWWRRRSIALFQNNIYFELRFKTYLNHKCGLLWFFVCCLPISDISISVFVCVVCIHYKILLSGFLCPLPIISFSFSFYYVSHNVV